jgi:tetratricopeptide (TPR) repeat protein
MTDVEIANTLGEVRQAIWRQDWRSGQALCQKIVDDPDVSDVALAEASELLQTIEVKAQAESEVRLAVRAVEQALQEPTPDYGTLLGRLKRAKDLGDQHNLVRFNTQISGLIEDLERRRDLHVRFEEDHRRYREAREAGNYKLAMEIAQKLLEDAELSQQPGLADSAREWLSQIGQQIKHDQLADAIDLALGCEDYAWAIELFEQLPPHHSRYPMLAPQVQEAEIQLRQLQADMDRVETYWNNNRLDAAETVLGELPQRYRKNRTWRPLWLRFYSDVARRFTARADDLVAEGDFAQAGQVYRKAEMAYHMLLRVFEGEQNYIRMANMANTGMKVCGYLDEAHRAWQRVDIAAARAACDQAVGHLDSAPEAIQEVMRPLRQRAVDFKKSLKGLDIAVTKLRAAHAAYREAKDLDQVSAHLSLVLAQSSHLPDALLLEAYQLRDQLQGRRRKIETLVQKATSIKSQNPKKAAEAYMQAWQLSHITGIRDRALAFFWAQFSESDHEHDKQDWLEYMLQIDPDNEEAQAKLATLRSLPELEQALLPLRATVETLEGQAEPRADELRSLRHQLESLQDEAPTPELQEIVNAVLTRWERLNDAVNEAQSALQMAERQKASGRWEAATQTLRAAAESLEVEGQRRRLLDEAQDVRASYEKGKEAYRTARRQYEEAVQAYQRTEETRDYIDALSQVQQAMQTLDVGLATLESGVPGAWRQLREELAVLERKIDTVARTWEAAQSRGQPLAELVRQLRELGERQDPVVANLLEELTGRAIEESVRQADQAEADGYDQRALEHLRTAVDLGGDDPELQRRLQTLATRQERRERITSVESEIRVLMGQSGRLPDVSRLQTDLLHLLAEDAGQPTWVEAVERLLATVTLEDYRQFRHITDQAEDGEVEGGVEIFKQARAQYRTHLREADDALDNLKEVVGGKGVLGQRIIDEARTWRHFKQRLLDYGIATSAGALKEHIDAVKAYQRLRAAQQPGEYDYASEFNDARDALFHAVLSSADKRKAQAETLIEQGQYALAVTALEEIEAKFYGPVEAALPQLHARLSERFTDLGDLRHEAATLLQQARQRDAIAGELRAGEEEAAALLHQVMPPTDLDDVQKEATLNTALARLEDARLNDPEEVCSHALKRLDKLQTQIKEALRDHKRSHARMIINRVERDLGSARIGEDYQNIEELLAKVDKGILDTAYQSRHRDLCKRLEDRKQLPTLLDLADQELEQGHYSQAYEYYKDALKIAPILGRDVEFRTNHTRARKLHKSQGQIQELLKVANDKLREDPTEALNRLNEALNRAQTLDMQDQVANIQRLVVQAQAREALTEATRALKQGNLSIAESYAELARDLADQGEDTSTHLEAKQILKAISERSQRDETIEKQKIEVLRLLRERQWESALALLDELRTPSDDPDMQRAEEGKAASDRVKLNIDRAIADAAFTEADNLLNRARIELKLADDVADALQQKIETAERQFQTWDQKLELIIAELADFRSAGVHDVQNAIAKVQELLGHQDLARSVQHVAQELAQELQTLKQQLSGVTNVINQAQERLDAGDARAALQRLGELGDQFTLTCRGQTFEIRHAGSERVQQIRHDAIAHQFALMQRQLDGAHETLVDVLLAQRETWDTFRDYLETQDEIAKFDDLRGRLSEIIAAKKNEKQCGAWEDRLKDAQDLLNLEQHDGALRIAREVEKEADAAYRDPETPLQNINRIREVWKAAFNIVREIEHQIAGEVEGKVRQALGHTETLEQKGDIYQIIEAESHLNDLLENDRLTETHRGLIRNRLQRLTDFKQALDEAKTKLERIERLVNLRNYREAAEILSSPCPPALQPRWDALAQVVGLLRDGNDMLHREDQARYGNWSTRLREYSTLLQKSVELHDSWPETLPEMEAWLRNLRREISQLITQLREALSILTCEEAVSALNRGEPDTAQRLLEKARQRHWVLSGQESRFEDVEHEIKVTRTALALEAALLNGEEFQELETQLRELQRSSHMISDLRRQHVLGLLRLVEIRTLIQNGNVELAQEYITNQRLMSLQPFEVISHEVNIAVRHREEIRRLTEHLNDLIYTEDRMSFQGVPSWLGRARMLADEGQTLISDKLDQLRDRLRQEVKLARQQLDYERLRWLNPLALELGLAVATLADLQEEQKRRFQEAIAAVREALECYEPAKAREHLNQARRLCDQDRERRLISDLESRLQGVEATAHAVDQHIEDAERHIVQGEYEAAVQAYQEAARKARQRGSVIDFTRRQHERFYERFETFKANEQYFQALETADRALQFGFETEYWHQARQELIRERDTKVQTLVEQLAGPGYNAQAQDITSGALAAPDPDLERARNRLKTALAWDPSNVTVKYLLAEVERRLKHVAEIRLDLQRGWSALDAARYSEAQALFANAHQPLSVEHPGIRRWLHFAETLSDMVKHVNQMAQSDAVIDIRTLPGDVVRVIVHPGWEKTRVGLQKAWELLTNLEPALLLGERGAENRDKQQTRIKRWLAWSAEIDEHLSLMQQCYDGGGTEPGRSYQDAATYKEKAERRLKDLGLAIRGGAALPLDQSSNVGPTFEEHRADAVPVQSAASVATPDEDNEPTSVPDSSARETEPISPGLDTVAPTVESDAPEVDQDKELVHDREVEEAEARMDGEAVSTPPPSGDGFNGPSPLTEESVPESISQPTERAAVIQHQVIEVSNPEPTPLEEPVADEESSRPSDTTMYPPTEDDDVIEVRPPRVSDGEARPSDMPGAEPFEPEPEPEPPFTSEIDDEIDDGSSGASVTPPESSDAEEEEEFFF